MLVSKDNFLFTCLKQGTLRRNTGAKCATKRIKVPNQMQHPGWLQGYSMGRGKKNLHYAFTIIHLEGYQFARIQGRCLSGEISNGGK